MDTDEVIQDLNRRFAAPFAGILSQNKVLATPAQLHMVIMATICGLKDEQPNQVLRSMFRAGLDLNNNAVYQDFVQDHADDAFWAMVR